MQTVIQSARLNSAVNYLLTPSAILSIKLLLLVFYVNSNIHF